MEGIANIPSSPGGTKDRPREISVLGWLNIRIYIFRKKWKCKLKIQKLVAKLKSLFSHRDQKFYQSQEHFNTLISKCLHKQPRECPAEQAAPFDCCQVKESQDEPCWLGKPQGHHFQWKTGWLEVLGGEVPCQDKEEGLQRDTSRKRDCPQGQWKIWPKQVDEKEKSKICEKNELAFKELVLSIDTSGGDGQVAFRAICCCKNDDYKNRNVVDAWKHLMDKYAPNIVPIKLELKSKFQQSKLWDALQDLDVWISKLKSIQARLKEVKSDILDENYIVHILNGLPVDYKVQVSKLEEHFGSASNLPMIQDMCNKLN